MSTKKQMQKRWLLAGICMLLSSVSNFLLAQNTNSIIVQLNKETFAKGDTINIEATLPNYAAVAKTATLQLWVENVKTGRRWKFRYPLVNGYINAKLKIDSSMDEGAYAFNFLLQKTFFSLTGHAANAGKKDKLLNYIMISKNKEAVVDVAALNEQKDFSIRNLLFQDSAFIIFSRPKQKNNDLQVEIKTALDSSFVPAASVAKFIFVGDTTTAIKKTDTSGYVFKPDDTRYKIILQEVVVRSKSNKRLKDFENENTTGSFSSEDAIVLDGLSSDEIANAPDLYNYLSIKVGGLRVVTDNETGTRSLIWRGQPTEIYINELRLDAETPLWINPADIALIKVFRPGTSLTSDAGAGGAIAIYTKTGEYRQAGNRNYSFYISGYTGLESTWK
ncbi:MAG: hypothetical protein V4685_12890 [Bacteroidota bacterium]